MKRTVIALNQDIAQVLEEKAKQEGLKLSTLVNQILRKEVLLPNWSLEQEHEEEDAPQLIGFWNT